MISRRLILLLVLTMIFAQGCLKKRSDLVLETQDVLIKKHNLDNYFLAKKNLKSGKGYYVSNVLRTVATTKFDPRLGEKIDEKHGHTIYKVPGQNNEEIMIGEKTNLPMVLNLKSHSFGVVTGNFIINLKSGEKIQPLLKKYDLSLNYKSDGIIYYYTSSKTSAKNYGQVYRDLKNDDRIKEVIMEIIDSSNLPQ